MAERTLDELLEAVLEDDSDLPILVAAIATAPLAKLLELLTSPREIHRRAAVLGAKSRTEPEIEPALLAKLQDSGASVRASVAEVAVDRRALLGDDALLTLLGDIDELVRAAAAAAARGRFALQTELIARLSDGGWRVREATAKALASATDPAAFTGLVTRLGTDGDVDVRRACAISADGLLSGREKLAAYPTPALPVLRKASENAKALDASYPTLVRFCEEILTREVDVEALRDHGTLVSAEALEGRLPKAHGVDPTCDAIVRVLTGDGARAVVILGAPGTGKTSVVHEVTRRLASDPTSPWHVVQIAPGEFVAGTKYTGEWETKVAKLIEHVRAPKRALLYVPDLEQLSQVGRWSKSDVNVASMLAPHIERGAVAILGESTTEAFRTGLGAILSIRRLFTAFEMRPTTHDETRGLLRAIVDEESVAVDDTLLERVIELAAFYFAASEEPGRSAGLLRRVLSEATPQSGPPTEQDVVAVLSSTTGIPAAILDDSLPLDRAGARAFLEARVMGQKEAVDALVDLVTLVKAGLTDPGKPLGVMLFVGPTGVGKTELARSLAEMLFGDPGRLVRFDMSEFASYEAYERLIGRSDRAPGLLTEAVRERPFCVLLLDEIEKAHVNVFDLCLQIFDAGRLTDASGHTTDFRRTIVILTSNVGSRVERAGPVGFGRGGTRVPERDGVSRELARVFRPEFLNRLDRIVIFRPLDEETAARIARRELAAVLERSGIRRRKLTVDVDPDVHSLLLREGYSLEFGARPLKRTVEKLVLLPLARAIASGKASPGAILRLVTRTGKIEVDVDAPRSRTSPQTQGPRVEAPASRAPSLLRRVQDLRARSEPMDRRKTELLARAAAHDFWSAEEAARAVLDDVYRIEGVLRALDELEEAARNAEGERAGGKEFAELERRAEHLDLLLAASDPDGLGDAFVGLRLVSSHGVGLDAVGTLARMYLGFARRHAFEVHVLDDRSGGDPAEDAVALLVTGPGAHALLAAEGGLHEVTRGVRGRRPEDDDEPRPSDRDVVRIEVLPARANARAFGRDELRVDVRSLARAHERLVRPRYEIDLLHVPTMIALRAWAVGRTDPALDRLRAYLRARVDAAAANGELRRDEAARADAGPRSATSAMLIRRYALGPTPAVRDLRTGKKTTKLDRVLDGRIEMFLGGDRAT